jgi:hypothetical protein
MYAKLDAAMAAAIFAKKGKEPQLRVAVEFGVTQTTVSSIWLGKTWRHVTGMPEYVSSKRRGASHQSAGVTSKS